MARLEIDIEETLISRLRSFQNVVHEIIEEELTFDDYVQVVIMQGLEKMLGDIIPADPETLWITIRRMAEENPGFVSQFIVEALRRGGEITQKDEAKKKLGFLRE